MKHLTLIALIAFAAAALMGCAPSEEEGTTENGGDSAKASQALVQGA